MLHLNSFLFHKIDSKETPCHELGTLGEAASWPGRNADSMAPHTEVVVRLLEVDPNLFPYCKNNNSVQAYLLWIMNKPQEKYHCGLQLFSHARGVCWHQGSVSSTRPHLTSSLWWILKHILQTTDVNLWERSLVFIPLLNTIHRDCTKMRHHWIFHHCH